MSVPEVYRTLSCEAIEALYDLYDIAEGKKPFNREIAARYRLTSKAQVQGAVKLLCHLFDCAGFNP